MTLRRTAGRAPLKLIGSGGARSYSRRCDVIPFAASGDVGPPTRGTCSPRSRRHAVTHRGHGSHRGW